MSYFNRIKSILTITSDPQHDDCSYLSDQPYLTQENKVLLIDVHEEQVLYEARLAFLVSCYI